MKQISGIPFKTFNLLLSQGFLVLDNIFLAFRLGRALNFLGINRFFALILTLKNIAIEFLLSFLVHDFIGIIINIFFFLNLLGMVNNHIGLQIELGDIHGNVIFLAI